MVYGYIRVSTDRQTVENQRFEISRFCAGRGIAVDGWVSEVISGTREPEKRALGRLLGRMRSGDVMICAELSRLGRSLMMIMAILNECMKRDIRIWTIKDNYRLGTDISSQVLAFAFGLAAEIERNLISQRTREALRRRRAEGVRLGRPRGRRNSRLKLSGRENFISDCLAAGIPRCEIATRLHVHRGTLTRFIDANRLV